MDSYPICTNRPALLLFDVDGTLLLSHGGSLRAMTRAAQRLFGPTFSLEAVDRNGQLDPDIIALALELNGVQASLPQLDTFRKTYLAELRAELGSTRPLPGVSDLLSRLRMTEEIILGLVTGNYAEAARLKLAAAGIDPAWFAVGGFGEDAATRAELVRLAIRAAGSIAGCTILPANVIVLGDTPRDVASARENGCKCLAVATGNYSQAALRSAGADAVVGDLTDPAPLWGMLAKPLWEPR